MTAGGGADPAAVVSRLSSAATRRLTPCGEGWMTWRVWGRGRPLVLLHGASGAWTHWIRNIEPLSRQRTLLVADMPGFGDSDMPPGAPTAHALADVVARGVDELVPPPGELDIAGFSFGGIIGGLVAARLGQRVGRLVLLGAGGFALPPIGTPALLPLTAGMSPAETAGAHRENLHRLMISERARVDDLAVFVHMENLRRARFKSGSIPASDVLVKALPEVRARITGIWAGRDAFTASRRERVDEYRRLLAAVQPDVDFRVIADSGHWTIYEAADELNALLQDVLGDGAP